MNTLATELREAIIKFAKKIGRWIVEHLVKRGAEMLRGYMLGKIEDFRRRRAKTTRPRRKRWLDGRIRRWSAVAKWLGEKAGALAQCTGQQFDELTAAAELQRVPTVARCERLVAA